VNRQLGVNKVIGSKDRSRAVSFFALYYEEFLKCFTNCHLEMRSRYAIFPLCLKMSMKCSVVEQINEAL